MKITALIAVLLLAASARAIELSLEENRGERGSVGYVDMQRLFTNSPDSQRAKEGFEDLVRQAEERVNLRKAELLKLRQQLDATRVERDALAHSMSLAPVPSTAAPAAALVPAVTPPPPAASTGAATAAPAPAAPPAEALSPAAQALLAASASTAPATAPASANHARELALPGMAATEPEPVAPPAAKSGVPSSDGAAAVPAASTAAPAAAKGPVPSSDGAAAAPPPAPKAAAKNPVPSSDGAAAVPKAPAGSAAGMFPAPPPAAPVAQAPAGPTAAQRLLELDSKIISLQADIAHKESELTQEHDDADRGLLDVESRKTDQVLARLYRAVSEVARREGVSVVIDKTTILYGHPAVDLTDKVLKYLEEKPKETPAP